MSILTNLIEKTPTYKAWKKIGIHPHHGIALPLSSLHSEKSCGIGEFLDLLPVIDWCSEIGFDTIQLLPLNDTGHDISPYSAISSCALDPVYLSLANLFPEKDLSEMQKFDTKKRVDYQKIKEIKLAFLEENFGLLLKDKSRAKSFEEFSEKHTWLPDYCLYRILLEKHKYMPWPSWEKAQQTLSAKEKTKLLHQHEKKVKFYSYLQFLCFEQMNDVKKYAEGKKVFIKGDIPILLSPNSADVWANQELFILDQSAGAPPDMYSAEGQNWGFPLFNWEKLKETGYSWWKQRLKMAEHCFHMYRIDHIVGFFRIWAIDPKDEKGRFLSKNRHLWPFQGRERLEMMIHSSSMLPIAEDLGIVPLEAGSILKELGICGTRVMRWQRYWEEDGSYIPGDNYGILSLTTVGTHDSETLEQWWKEYPSDVKGYLEMKGWKYEAELSFEMRKKILQDSHETESIFHINPLQEYLALYPELISEDPDDERINVPGKNLKTNWTYRFRPSIEKMASHKQLLATIKALIPRKT